MAHAHVSGEQPSLLRRWFPHPLLSLALTLIWLLLINSFSAGGLLVGLTLASPFRA